MGNVISMPTTPIEIAKSNKNAPLLYRKHNVEDHLFNYEIKQTDNNNKLRLKLQIEMFNKNIEYFVDKKPIDEINFDKIEKIRTLLDKEYALEKTINKDINTREVLISLESQEKHVYLCRNYITSLNENIGVLKETQVLQICCNYITQLPYSIKHLRNLKMLILSRNRIKELPEELGCCKELRELDLSHNLIEHIPTSIASLKTLTVLQMSNNKLTSVSSAIGKCTSLKNIYLDNNNLEYLPLEMLKLPFLANLTTDNNPLVELEESTFTKLGRDTLLEMSCRQIVRNNVRIPHNLSKYIKNVLLGVKECSFCGGPFFNSYYKIEAMHEHENRLLPVQYFLCTEHYSDHSERLTALFSSTHENTKPVQLIKDNLPSVTEIFEPFCHTEELQNKINEEFDEENDDMPLISLSLYNSSFFKKFIKDKKRNISELNESKRSHFNK